MLRFVDSVPAASNARKIRDKSLTCDGKPRTYGFAAGRECGALGCKKPVHAKGYCHSHYKTHAPRKQCSVSGCTAKITAQDRCMSHYERAMNSGEISVVRPVGREPRERFFSTVSPADQAGCVIWTGYVDTRKAEPRGYFTIGGRPQPVHRVAWMFEHGSYPEGPDGGLVHLDHRCRVTLCVNPAHMEPVSPEVNSHRGQVARGRRPMSEADVEWFLIALNAWLHGADNFPASVVSHERDTEAAS